MCVDPGYEHKEKPSGASTNREAKIAKKKKWLQIAGLDGKENEHGGTGARQSLT